MPDILQTLQSIVGKDNVLRDEESRQLFVTDVYSSGAPAKAVVKPSSTEELSAIIKATVAEGIPLVPRGGGMSYTSGYVPKYEDSILLDMAHMDKVLEVNTEDMYVTVEAGCTWKTLYETLQETGYRTPFWGTLSGINATIGGGLSQNCIFWGSSAHGPAADSVMSMSVVLANGTVVKTGSAAHQNGSPWYRHYGPDLTGIFIGDGGALGFKATLTLKLIPETPYRTGLSFAAETGDQLLAFASEVAKRQLATEVCGFDPFLQKQRLKRESLAKDFKQLGGVMKSAGGIKNALIAGAKVALAGRGYMKDVKFSIHTLVEERYQELANIKEKELRALATEHGLREIENSIPTIMRANPFGNVNSMVGPEGERWLPVHGISSHSKVRNVYKKIEELYESYAVELEKFQIGCGFLFATISNNSVVIEPVFFWPEQLNALHKKAVEKDHLKKLPQHPSNPEATAMVETLKQELIKIFTEEGSVHMQLGKAYPYHKQAHPEALQLVQAIKDHVDPTCLLNPGTLGLEGK